MLHKRAVFFDRDGTLLIPPKEYISQADHVDFYPGVPESLCLLKNRGFRRIVVTNQAAIGRGMISELQVLPVHNHMKRELASREADLDAILYSSYYPAAGHPEHRRRAGDRKPEPGMFEKAAARFHLSLKDSFVVGDSPEDLQSARRIGARAVLVRTGKGRETERESGKLADAVTDTMAEAAVWICRQVGPTTLTGKKIVMILAGRNFQEREYLVPRLTLESLGADVLVAGPGKDECVGTGGLRVTPDLTHRDANPENLDAVVFVGGEGARALAGCRVCQDLARKTYEAKKVVAAICVAPAILANARLLHQKSATAWHTELPLLRSLGARLSHRPVVRHETLVTAAGPQNAEAFADAIRASLLGEKQIEMTVATRAANLS